MKKFSFEEALKRLEEITQILELDQPSLEETLKLYEEAIELRNQCNEYLKKAEGKITKIINHEKKILKEVSTESILNENGLFS